MDSPTDLLSPAEAAKALGVAVETIRRYEAAGKLEAVRTPGNHRRFRRSDIDAIVSPAPAVDGAA